MQGYAARTHPATALADPLCGRTMVLESAGERLAVVGTDLVGIDLDLANAVREIAERECGIPAEAIMVGGSHTHWGPAIRPVGYLSDLDAFVRPEYASELALKLAMSIVLADHRRAPARIGVGAGWNPLISFNRRPLDAAGTCETTFSAPEDVARWAAAEGARQAVDTLGLTGVGATPLQPPPARPDSDLGRLTWGPTDPQVPVIRVESERGTLGGVVSFACHPVCGAGDETFYDFSADYPGAMQRRLTECLGCPVVFALGCAGNQVPVMRGPGSRERVGHSLAAEVLRVWESIDLHDDVPLSATRVAFDMPIKDFARMERPEGDNSQSRYIRHLIDKHAGETHVAAEVQALRVGDMALVSLPGEIFVEIGHEIKRRSPFPLTMPVTVANGCLGYVGTPESYAQGGYEVTWNSAVPESAGVLAEAALTALNALV
jgi:neutral ceramidase